MGDSDTCACCDGLLSGMVTDIGEAVGAQENVDPRGSTADSLFGHPAGGYDYEIFFGGELQYDGNFITRRRRDDDSGHYPINGELAGCFAGKSGGVYYEGA